MSHASGVPKRLHQIWWQGANEVPEKYDDFSASVRQHLPSVWEYRVWNGRDIVDLAAEKFPKILSLLQSDSIRMIQKCDLGRLLVLAAHGGVYLDMDVRVFDSLDRLLDLFASHASTGGRFFIAQEALFINNYMLACDPKNKFCLAAIDNICTHLRADRSLFLRSMGNIDTVFLTGPLMFRDLVMRPDVGRFVTVLFNFEIQNIVTHCSQKDWLPNASNFTLVNRVVKLTNDMDHGAYEVSLQYAKSVRPHAFLMSALAGGAITGATEQFMAGSLVLFIALYIDHTQMCRVVRGGVQDHAVALGLFGTGTLVGFMARRAWATLNSASATRIDLAEANVALEV